MRNAHHMDTQNNFMLTRHGSRQVRKLFKYLAAIPPTLLPSFLLLILFVYCVNNNHGARLTHEKKNGFTLHACELSSSDKVHLWDLKGSSQMRTLEWVIVSSSRGSWWPRDRTWSPVSPSPALAGGFFTTEPPRNPMLFQIAKLGISQS